MFSNVLPILEAFEFNCKYVEANIDFAGPNIPDAKSYFLIEKSISNYKVNFDIKSKKIKDDIVEVDTTLKLVSGSSDDNKINISNFTVIMTYIINKSYNIW